MDNKSKTNQDFHSRERCQKIWFQMMICYALQATTFIMQKFENASKSWSFGEKGKKSQNKIKTNPKHFMRNADKLTAWKGVTEESWPFWSTENSTKLFFEFEQKCRYQFYFALALLLFIADCLSNQGLRMPALGWASTKAWGCSPQKDQLSLLYLGHRDSLQCCSPTCARWPSWCARERLWVADTQRWRGWSEKCSAVTWLQLFLILHWEMHS